MELHATPTPDGYKVHPCRGQPAVFLERDRAERYALGTRGVVRQLFEHQPDSVVQLALRIADDAMFSLLESECIPLNDDRTVYGLLDESYSEVFGLTAASDAIRDAIAWLQPRGFVELANEGIREVINVLRKPG